MGQFLIGWSDVTSLPTNCYREAAAMMASDQEGLWQGTAGPNLDVLAISLMMQGASLAYCSPVPISPHLPPAGSLEYFPFPQLGKNGV